MELSALLTDLAGEEPRIMVQTSGPCVHSAEPLALRRIVGNLVANALRYSTGPVTLRLDCREQPPVVFVLDRGPGIPEAERQRLVAGVAAQYESEVVYHQIREDLEAQGVIFLDTDTALREHPEIFQEYFGTVIPAGGVGGDALQKIRIAGIGGRTNEQVVLSITHELNAFPGSVAGNASHENRFVRGWL